MSASAALTGLVFVAVSINIKRILDFPSLPRRVPTALFMLNLVLFTSTVAMIPRQPSWLLGLEQLLLGVVVTGGPGSCWTLGRG